MKKYCCEVNVKKLGKTNFEMFDPRRIVIPRAYKSEFLECLYLKHIKEILFVEDTMDCNKLIITHSLGWRTDGEVGDEETYELFLNGSGRFNSFISLLEKFLESKREVLDISHTDNAGLIILPDMLTTTYEINFSGDLKSIAVREREDG